MAGQDSHQEARAGARIAQVQDLLGRRQPAQATAPDPPGAVGLADDLGAERGHRLGGAQHVFALEQAADPGLAHGERADHQGPVRDRFVAWDLGAAGERLAGLGGKRSHGSKGFGAASSGGPVSSTSPRRHKVAARLSISQPRGAFTF